MARYLIPKPIQRTYEIFPGWGLVQAGIVVVGLAAGALIFWVIALLHGPIFLMILLALLAAGSGGVLAFPPPMNEPAYRTILRARNFVASPKKWLYDWNSSDWPD